MTVVTVHEAKTNLSRLIKKAALGEEVIIARGLKAVARLVPIGEVAGRRRPGSLKGKLRVTADFFKPLPASELRRRE
jgi:antitoxin (DNA-binding transcriptional repressor) of toxin-antitoxin stability system